MVPLSIEDLPGKRWPANNGAAELPVPEECHPKITKLVDYWRAQHPEQGLPGRQHIDPVDIPELLPNVWLIDVQHNPLRYRLRLVGTRIVAYAGEDNTGQWLHERWPDYDDAPMRQTVLSGKPTWWRGPSQFRPEKSYFELERVRLPLSGDGKTVDMLFCLTIFYDQNGKEVLAGF